MPMYNNQPVINLALEGLAAELEGELAAMGDFGKAGKKKKKKKGGQKGGGADPSVPTVTVQPPATDSPTDVVTTEDTMATTTQITTPSADGIMAKLGGMWTSFRESPYFWPVTIGVVVIGGVLVAKKMGIRIPIPGMGDDEYEGMLVSGAQDTSAMGGFASAHQSKFGSASAACRAEGVRPFTKQFGACMKGKMGR